MTHFDSFLLSFAFNFLVVLLIVRFIYYPSTHNKSYVFTFMAFSSVIFFVLSFMASIEIGIGVGFGLFAIFSILRYRTDPIPIREMTYLFVTSAIPLMNAAGVSGTLWPELLVANLAVLVIMLVLEKEWGFHYETYKQIVYEKIELIRPERRAALKADLEERTGLKIKRILVGKVDFLHDVANIKVYYDDPSQANWLGDTEPVEVELSKDTASGF
jgi:hypothetical protein